MVESFYTAIALVVYLAPLIIVFLALRWLMDLRSQGKEQTALLREQNEMLRALIGARDLTAGSEDERDKDNG